VINFFDSCQKRRSLTLEVTMSFTGMEVNHMPSIELAL